MDLTPLYDLRERLKTGAVAGTALIAEDFRLARALEAFTPFETVAPVFAKLGQSVRNLLSPECANRPEALMDTLSLCDAVLTTQAITTVEGAIEPLPPASGTVFSNVPYSTLSPVLDALTTSGSGKYSTVVDTHSTNPQLFSDYRIKHAMVTALGASYAELAEQVAKWLYDEGKEIVPLLKQGFDPNGKKEMVRRIQVMDHVAGASENEFYLSLLDNSEKEIKAMAIYALRHLESNAELLINLAKTEKGNAKKMAHWALAQLNLPVVWEYWNKVFEKKPEVAAEYMTLATTEKSSKAIGKSLLNLLESLKTWDATQEDDIYPMLEALMLALPGKSGEEICTCYEMAAALKHTLDKPMAGRKDPYYFRRGSTYNSGGGYVFSKYVPVMLASSIVFNPTSDLIAVAHKLHEKFGFSYILPVLVAELLTKNSHEAYNTISPILELTFRLTESKVMVAETLNGVKWVLENLNWKDNNPIPEILLYFHNPAEGGDTVFSRQLAAPLDQQLYFDLIQHKKEFLSFLLTPTWPEDAKLRQALAKYFYDRCAEDPADQRCLRALEKQGWSDYTGFFKRFCKNAKQIEYWTVDYYLSSLPVSNEEKVQEMEWLLKNVEEKKFVVKGSYAIDYLKKILERYRGVVE